MKYYFVQSYQKYPLMRLEDFVKQAYQAQFGCGHLLGGNVEQYIRNEMVKASPTGNLWDAIGNGMCRVNLGDCRQRGYLPSLIANVMKISRKTMAIVKENIVFALGVKGLVLILGAVGLASMWAAVFADVGVAVIAILNSMRTLRK